MGRLRVTKAARKNIMPKILSVSYDTALLSTRELILQSKGYEVTSVCSLTEGLKECKSGIRFDLFIIGHSIPNDEKETLIRAFRANWRGPVLAVERSGEAPVPGADSVIEPNPLLLLDSVAKLLRQERTQC